MAAVRARVWLDDDEMVDREVLATLPPLERAIFVTRTLEDQLLDGGWYLVFANEDEDLIGPAIEGYELLGLAGHAAHLRHVLACGYGDASPESEGERLDELYAALSGADAARATMLAASPDR